MSDFTTELRYICESEAGLLDSKGYNSIDEIIALARPKIFNFYYPIYDENHREELETKILKHYYTREIGLETYGLWKLKLNTRMNEIMPYYNQLYESVDFDYNPMYDVNYEKSHIGSNNVRSNSNSSIITASDTTKDSILHEESSSGTDTTRWDKFSDTPQGSLQNIENDTYLTSARKNTEDYEGSGEKDGTTNETLDFNESKSTNASNIENGDDEYIETIKGKIGTYSYSKMIKDFREQVINVDMMIIKELSNLFMLLW